MFQATGFLFWCFTLLYDVRATPLRNRIVPKMILFTCDFIFVYIPAAKVLIYLFYVYKSSLLEGTTAPFLLMSTITCIFILLVWYSYIISPYIDECKNQLKDEYRWEEERLFMQEKKALSVAGSTILPKLESEEE